MDAAGRWTWDDDAGRDVAERFRGWTSCNPRGAMDELRTYLHDDFVYVSVFGERYDKDAYVALASTVTPDSFYVVHAVRARVRGDVAAVDGTYHVTAHGSDGHDMTADTRFTGVWVRHPDGPWLALTHHGTRYHPE